MKLNKTYLYFMRYFQDQEIAIYQGQLDDESIARNAFYEGIKYQKAINQKLPLNKS